MPPLPAPTRAQEQRINRKERERVRPAEGLSDIREGAWMVERLAPRDALNAGRSGHRGLVLNLPTWMNVPPISQTVARCLNIESRIGWYPT